MAKSKRDSLQKSTAKHIARRVARNAINDKFGGGSLLAGIFRVVASKGITEISKKV